MTKILKNLFNGFLILLILSSLFVCSEKIIIWEDPRWNSNTWNITPLIAINQWIAVDTWNINPWIVVNSWGVHITPWAIVETWEIQSDFMMTYPNWWEKVSWIINITRTQFTSDWIKSKVRLFLINEATSTTSLISPMAWIVDVGSYFWNTANKEDWKNYKIKVQSVDLQSIEDATNSMFMIDNTPPTIPRIDFNGYIPWYVATWRVNFDMRDWTDSLAWVYQSQYRLNNWIRVKYISQTPITAIWMTEIEARTLDNAGNISKIIWPYNINLTKIAWNGNASSGVICNPESVINWTVDKITCDIICITWYIRDWNICTISSFTPICDAAKLMCVNDLYQLSPWASCQWGQLYQTCTSTWTTTNTTTTTWTTTTTTWTTNTTWANKDTGNNDILKPLSLVTQNRIAQFREYNKDRPIITSLHDSNYNKELQDAYIFAYMYGITTKKTIQEAEMDTIITRAEIAKMVSQYAINILWKPTNTGKVCVFQDIWNIVKDLQNNISLSCQLWIMGVQNDLVLNNFYADELVNRAQFATILSRALRGNQYNTTDTIDYYKIIYPH